MQHPRIGVSIKHIIGGDQRHAGGRRKRLQPRQMARILACPVHSRRQPHRAGAGGSQLAQQRLVRFGGDQQQIIRVGEQIGQMQRAITLLRAAVAQCEQPGEPPPAVARGRVGDDIRGLVSEYEPRAHHQPERAARSADFPPRHMRADHARHGVAIGNPDPAHPQREGAVDHFRRMRCTAQEAEIAGGNQFGKFRRAGIAGAVHANSPCRYHLGSGFSSYSPCRKIQKRRPRTSSTR